MNSGRQTVVVHEQWSSNSGRPTGVVHEQWSSTVNSGRQTVNSGRPTVVSSSKLTTHDLQLRKVISPSVELRFGCSWTSWKAH